MLSKFDIEKELGKGISIIQFKPENIKENSMSLSAREYAWCMSNYEFEEEYIDDNKEQIKLINGEKCVFNINGKKTIVIPPYSTVLVETKEVLGIDGGIGGTYHSKVGIVSLGIGHIGTMLGPGFCGHSLIAIHNVSKERIELRVGETFVSVVFNYLETKINTNNQTKSGHIEKFGELGINISREDREFICSDWKCNLESIIEKMEYDQNFIEFKENLKKRKLKNFRSLINKRNIIATVILIIVICIIYILASIMDKGRKEPVWVGLYCSVLISVIIIPFTSWMIKKLYNIS